MATTKTINTRIQLRYDTLENWQSKAEAGKGALLVLNKGEVALCYVPAVVDTATQKVLTAPTVLFKVGDGTGKTFEQLPWGSALAADVYGWAKTPEKPTYTAAEIQGLPEDTDTQYQIVKVDDYTYKLQSKPLGDSSWTDVSTIDIPKDTLVEGTTNGAVVFNGDIVHVHGLGSAAYAETTAFDAAGTANTVKTELTGTTADTWATNKTLNAVHKEAAAAQEAANNAQATANNAVVANGAITAATKNSLVKYDEKGLVVSGVVAGTAATKNVATEAISTSANDNLVTGAQVKTYVDSAVAGISGAMHFVGVSTTNPKDPETGATVAGHTKWAAGDVVIFGNKEFVLDKAENKAANWHELGDESIYAIKGEIVNDDIKANAAIDQSKISGLAEALAGKATPADITTEIKKLDAAEKGGAGKYIQSISQTDGKIAAVEATMPDVSGKLDKATKTGDGTYVYTVSGSTQATTWQVATSSEPAPGQIPTYDALSRLKTADPNADNDAANKKFVVYTIDKKLGEHAGIDKEGTVTSVAAGTGLKVTGTASVNPIVEIDDAVIFILNGGSATTVI